MALLDADHRFLPRYSNQRGLECFHDELLGCHLGWCYRVCHCVFLCLGEEEIRWAGGVCAEVGLGRLSVALCAFANGSIQPPNLYTAKEEVVVFSQEDRGFVTMIPRRIVQMVS